MARQKLPSTSFSRDFAIRYADADTTLRLGVVSTMPARHLVGYLRALQDAAPDLDLRIWEANCEELGGALTDGKIDVAIMTTPEYPDTLRPIPLFRERYHVAFSAGHRFEHMNAVPMREFEDEDYIKRIHCEFPSNFARLGITKPYQAVRVRYSGEREDWVQAMVCAGLGMTLMPEHLPILHGIETRLVVEPEVHRQISMVTVAGRPHAKPVELAVNTARAFAWDRVVPESETLDG